MTYKDIYYKILENTDEKISDLEILRKNLDKVMDDFDNTVKPKLIENLQKCGLNIYDITFCKTGSDSDVWNTGDALRFSILAKSWFPENTKGLSKFKFLNFKGYQASGKSINYDNLIKKTSELEKEIGFDCQVNPFSLELRNNETKDTKSVLIDLWLYAI